MEIKTVKNGTLHTWLLSDRDAGNALGPLMFGLLEKNMNELEDVCEEQLKNNLKRVSLLCISADSITNIKNNKKTWISGGNIKELKKLNAAQAMQYSQMGASLGKRIRELPIPVLMTIDGAAIGGGAEFTLFADIRWATKGSSLQFKQLDLGLCLGFSTSVLLKEYVGLGKMQELLWLGRKIPSSDAHNLGLIHEEFLHSNLMFKEAERLAEKFARLDPISLKSMKQQIKLAVPVDNQRQSRIFSRCWDNSVRLEFMNTFGIKSKS